MTLGDSSTDADVFEGVPFRGAMLASDDDMLPESLRGYAPVVRGLRVLMLRSLFARTAMRFTRPTLRLAL